MPEPYPGNVYNKYDSRNPLTRRLVARFLAELDGLVDELAPADLLDVGCGEGVVTEHLAARLPPGARVVGLDRDVPKLRAAWATRDARVELITGDAHALPFADGSFDVVTLIEMLQLVTDPAQALAEATRVARRGVVVTVPDEPLWRALNVARGAYLAERGNTPGHIHHWSSRAFMAQLAPHGQLVTVQRSRPWLLAVIR
ncbi:methyltransferase domain-containing protein [Solirubrobacter phytolaccae]|uniref:Methyltransferase domain-containing protein n=1 Tax=Solirubrobacter phytolaccae TaxID=1404360 RepID=A0A9X3N5D0_9ACTN|nr:methyltransferase domain-containing protein [Solirubrobacter phytolaccae]MDA0180038.1 methyltransferase domain-containing protein [Solirubrobacter phytolaccae]